MAAPPRSSVGLTGFRRSLAVVFLAGLLRCGEQSQEGVRYESVSAKSGDVAAVVVSGNGREVTVGGRRRDAQLFVWPWVFRDRGWIGKVWLAWEEEGDRISVLLCQSEGRPAVETVDLGQVWGTDGRQRPYSRTKSAAVTASLRANFPGVQRLRSGGDDDDSVGAWFCSDHPDNKLGRFARDGGKTYMVP